MPTQEVNNKTAESALLGLTFIEAFASRDNEMRQLIFDSYPSLPEAQADLVFALTTAFNLLLRLNADVEGVSEVEYIQTLRRYYLVYAEMLRNNEI